MKDDRCILNRLAVEIARIVTSTRAVGRGNLYLRPRLLVSSWPPATTELTTRPNPATITKRRNRERRTMAFIVSGLDLYMKRRPRPAHVSRTLRSSSGQSPPKNPSPFCRLFPRAGAQSRKIAQKEHSEEPRGHQKNPPRQRKTCLFAFSLHLIENKYVPTKQPALTQRNKEVTPIHLRIFQNKGLTAHRAPRIAPHMFISSASNHPIHVCECNSLRFQTFTLLTTAPPVPIVSNWKARVLAPSRTHCFRRVYLSDRWRRTPLIPKLFSQKPQENSRSGLNPVRL